MELFVNILNRLLFCIIDVQLGYVGLQNIEIFKVKLRWSKSLQLLQRKAFLVTFAISAFHIFCSLKFNKGLFLTSKVFNSM